jgi:putative PIN family toxin of toxin-antitoxin system
MKNNLIIVDTNTLLSSSLFKYGAPRKAVTKANQIGKIVASIETYNEFLEIFLRPKFDKYISRETRLEILLDFKKQAIFSKITETIIDCRDPKDNKFLELAVAAKASCIITGDKDLLVLHPFRGIPILNSTDFLEKF